MDRKLVEQYRSNAVLIDKLLQPLNQGFMKPKRPSSIFGWLFHVWPIWYGSIWICIYTYLIFGHGRLGGLALISQQIWCMMCVTQLVVKLTNGVFQGEKLQELFKWCEKCYTMDYSKEYIPVISGVYEKANVYITTCIRWV